MSALQLLRLEFLDPRAFSIYFSDLAIELKVEFSFSILNPEVSSGKEDRQVIPLQVFISFLFIKCTTPFS